MKDYHQILGLDPGASPEQIRAAYRRHAKRTHPDTSGSAGTEEFRKVQEAYEALRTPLRHLASQAIPIHRAPAQQDWGRDAFAEFLFPPSSSTAVPLQILLEPEEAALGGQVSLRAPLLQSCPLCRGRGGSLFWDCDLCSGQGRILRELPLQLTIPPGVRSGTRQRLPLGPRLWLDLLILVGPS